MNSPGQRLHRLAEVHREMSKLLEARVVQLTGELAELEQKRAATMQSVERCSRLGLGFYGPATRRLADIERAKVECERAIAEARRKLLNVDIRHDILMRRVMALSASLQRKVTEDEAREIALQMKATGKHHMVK